MAQAEQYDVFLSYRRDGGVKDAMLIKLALENRGYRVFFDLSGLGAGTFGRQLYQRIDECRDFVLIVSPHSLDRCANEHDWLRREIEYAIEKGKNIVPVLIDVNAIPDELPKQIGHIKELQSLKFSFEFFNHYNHFETLIDTVSSFLKSKPVLPSSSLPARQSAPPPSSSVPPKPTQPRKPDFVAGRDNVLMEDINDEYDEESAAVFSTTLERRQISSITFLDALADAPKNARDFSRNKNRSVLGWTRRNSNGLYDLYIAGEGGVSAPVNCYGLFMGYSNATRIDFNGAFHTNRSISFEYMFAYCEKLSVLDLSSFHTGNVADMSGMFLSCERLISLDVSSFDTSKVIDMYEMFSDCTSLKSLDISNFDFSHVKEYNHFMPDSLDPNWERYFKRR